MQHIRFIESDVGAREDVWQHAWMTKVLPWLIHQGPQGKTAFFTEWILSPGVTSAGYYLTGLRGGLRPAPYAEWKAWSHDLLGKGHAIDTLLALADHYGVKPLSLWVMLPYPYEQQEERRGKAVQKWAETVRYLWMKRFGLSGHRLEGFVWGREAIPDGDLQLVRSFNEWVRNYDLHTMWLANYGSTHVQDWRRLGFTQSALYSNYTGNGPYPKQWLDASMSFASIHHMGLQCIYGSSQRFAPNSQKHYLDAAVAYRNAGGKGPIVHRFASSVRHERDSASTPIYEDLYRIVTGKG